MAVCNSSHPSQQGLALEHVERAFLGKLLHEEKTIFSEDTVLGLSRDIACAMQYVHQRGYIHCYVGSSSVVLTENFRAKVRYFANLYGYLYHILEAETRILNSFAMCRMGRYWSPSGLYCKFFNKYHRPYLMVNSPAPLSGLAFWCRAFPTQ